MALVQQVCVFCGYELCGLFIFGIGGFLMFQASAGGSHTFYITSSSWFLPAAISFLLARRAGRERRSLSFHRFCVLSKRQALSCTAWWIHPAVLYGPENGARDWGVFLFFFVYTYIYSSLKIGNRWEGRGFLEGIISC